MIHYNKFQLDNGLTVIHHEDNTTPMAVVNTLYNVGARDEDEAKTGFAHLFEHLMFGGSINIPDFDAPLQFAGGESNAFTSNDITNYYDVLPAANIETALWLESDRMLSLAFTEKSLETQRSVVIEEFKQRYLNQPYGDVWLELRPLAYKKHPYKWATIGKCLEHIEEATMDDVKGFFKKHYIPNNAILTIAGPISLEKTKELTTKWFGDIPSGEITQRNLPQEEKQEEIRLKTIERDVPNDACYYAFHMVNRTHPDYFTIDLLSDALGREKSSRLYNKLRKELKLVTKIAAYITGSLDNGLFVIEAKLADGVTFEALDEAIWNVLEELKAEKMNDDELSKLVNKIKTAKAFQEQGLLHRAMNLSLYELLGDPSEINQELNYYSAINSAAIQRVSSTLFQKSNCANLRVKAIKK